ncbi:MAG: SDR family oxidoreductase [Akkermansia sp.]|nr:SDR family oxidoreductase [Akkermansia sp.]
MSCFSTVVITGASSGFGKAFAYRVAEFWSRQSRAKDTRFVLIARSEDKLQALADELIGRYGCEVLVWPCDLADAAARSELQQKLSALQSEWMMLINNAGLGDYGEFCTSEPERNRRMIEVNMTALVEITRTMLPAMQAAKNGYILNVASLAADIAIPDFAMYAASKAFVASFSEALRIELGKTQVHVTAVCPGPSHTGFGDVARRTGKSKKEVPFRKWFYTSVECVVDSAFRAVLANTPRCYPSLKIRLVGLFVRNSPLWLLRLIMSSRPRKAVPAE